MCYVHKESLSSSGCLLWSSDQGLSVPHSHFKSRGDCAFAVAAPKLCHSLPQSIRSVKSVVCYKLKTHPIG